MTDLKPFVKETETYARLATYFANDPEKRKKARDEYAEYMLDTSFKNRQNISKHFIEMTQDNPDQMQKLEVTRGVNLGAGAKVFMSEISNIFTKKEEEQKTRAQNVLEETNQIFYDLNQLHTASTYLQKTEPEHHKWSILAAQMTQNNIIDKYNLSLEKNNITLNLSEEDIDNIITYYRGNPDQLNDILLSRNDNFPLDSTSEKDAQAYVLINYLCDTNQNYYNCFKAISEERINSNASLSNIIPDNVRTFFKERSDFINEQLNKKAYDNLYTNGDLNAFETFVNEIPSKYDETLQELVDTYYTGGTKETGKPIEMVLRARVISTLDGCSKKDAQAILDNKKQNLQTYDTLVLEQPIDFSAFNKLTEETEQEETTETTQTLSLRKKVEQNHQKNQQPDHDLHEETYDYHPDNESQQNIFLGENYLYGDIPPEFLYDNTPQEFEPNYTPEFEPQFTQEFEPHHTQPPQNTNDDHQNFDPTQFIIDSKQNFLTH
jgi:hypothetical protein